jgi:hypothetical protein
MNSRCGALFVVFVVAAVIEEEEAAEATAGVDCAGERKRQTELSPSSRCDDDDALAFTLETVAAFFFGGIGYFQVNV